MKDIFVLFICERTGQIRKWTSRENSKAIVQSTAPSWSKKKREREKSGEYIHCCFI